MVEEQKEQKQEQEEQKEQKQEQEEQEKEEEEGMEEDLPNGASERRPQVRREGSGSYTMDNRGRIVVVASNSQLLSQHLFGKTPHDTLHYTTGDNLDAFATIAAELLQCQEVGSYTDRLLNMVSKLADPGTVSEPPSPCPPPASTASTDLEARDCTSHMAYICSLLQLVNRITLLAHYRIRGFLSHTTATAMSRSW